MADVIRKADAAHLLITFAIVFILLFMSENISVREMQERDIDLITDYFLNADDAFLKKMGVDVSRVPDRKGWRELLSKQLHQSYNEKTSYCIIWQMDNKPVGHSNVNKIIFGQEAYMHLHLWNADTRKKGSGAALVKMTLPFYFRNLQLKRLYCEPNAFNPAPNKTLEKVGFKFIKKHITTPGWLNFEQPVNRWNMTKEDLEKIT